MIRFARLLLFKYWMACLAFAIVGSLMSSCSNPAAGPASESFPSDQAIVSVPSQPAVSGSSSTSLPLSPTSTSLPFSENEFDDFQKLSGYCLVGTDYGVVLPGRILDIPFLSDSTIGQLTVALYWKEGELNMTLVQPDGTALDPADMQLDPVNLRFTSQPNYQEYFIRSPQPGSWIARITEKSSPPSGSPYRLEIWPSDATIFSVEFDREAYFTGDPIVVTSSIEDSLLDSPLGPEYIYGVTMQGMVEDPLSNRTSFELNDNGINGDSEARDGIYTGTLASAPLQGIYKLAFQVHGTNNRAGEPFTRACFLAKTVMPSHDATPASAMSANLQGCPGEIEISAPHVVRPAEAGGSDRCETCRYALYPRAVSTGSGILAVWLLGFDGQRPEPNAYGRLLDVDANPIEEVDLLFERDWIGKGASLINQNGELVLTFCGRYPGTDRLTSTFFDSYGQVILERPLEPADQTRCGYWGAQSVWSGAKLVSTWIYQGIAPDGSPINDVLLSVQDANGNSLAWKRIRPDGLTPPHLAIGHGHVLLVVLTSSAVPGQNRLAVHRFDLDGIELGEPLLLDPLTYEVDGRIVTGSFDTPFLVPTSNGWMLLASSRASGRYIAQLNPDGTIYSGPTILDIGLDFPNGFEDVLGYRNSAVVLGHLSTGDPAFLFLEPDGTRRDMLIVEEEAGAGDLFEHQERLFWITTSGPITRDPITNQVLLRELKCVP